jgi:hypothetical protein
MAEKGQGKDLPRFLRTGGTPVVRFFPDCRMNGFVVEGHLDEVYRKGRGGPHLESIRWGP